MGPRMPCARAIMASSARRLGADVPPERGAIAAVIGKRRGGGAHSPKRGVWLRAVKTRCFAGGCVLPTITKLGVLVKIMSERQIKEAKRAIEKAKERLDIELTIDDVLFIDQMVRRGFAKTVDACPEIKQVFYKDGVLFPVYNKHGCICTFYDNALMLKRRHFARLAAKRATSGVTKSPENREHLKRDSGELDPPPMIK